MIITLGQVIAAAKVNNTLGLTDRAEIIDCIDRAIELAASKANWNPWVGELNICSDCCGNITLPYFVDTVLACNVGGQPAMFRNSWYEFHINGAGEKGTCAGSMGSTWTDQLGSPVFQPLRDWSMVVAVCEDPIDGNGSKSIIVEGETMDALYNSKEALTIPPTGVSTAGVVVPMLIGTPVPDPAVTVFRRITRVTLPPGRRGYMKLLGVPPVSGSSAVVLGYYAPHEISPWYKRIKISTACGSARIKYRRKTLELVNDYDVVPINSRQAMVFLLKAIRFYDRDDVDQGGNFLALAVNLMNEVQTIEDGPAWAPMQVDPSFGIGTIDYR
jgi:hypothetical protein